MAKRQAADDPENSGGSTGPTPAPQNANSKAPDEHLNDPAAHAAYIRQRGVEPADEAQFFDHTNSRGAARAFDLSDPNSPVSKDFKVANGDQRTADYNAQKTSYDSRQAPTTNFGDALVDRQNGMQARGAQGDALSMYRDAAMGNGTSVAQASFAQSLQAQQAAQAAGAASARGGALARSAAQNTAMNNSAALGASSAGAMATLRAQEIANARQGYAGTATAMRTGDVSQQSQDAGQASFLTNTELTTRGQNDAMRQFYENQATHVADQGFQGQLAHQAAEENAIGADMGEQQIAAGIAATAQAEKQQYITGGFTAGGAILGSIIAPGPGTAAGAAAGGAAGNSVSDRRLKKDIKSESDAKVDSFLSALHAMRFDYKNPSAIGERAGTHTGVMAQDLEKSEIGRRLVRDTPQGKVIDTREGFGTALAAMASQNQRIKRLEDALVARKR